MKKPDAARGVQPQPAPAQNLARIHGAFDGLMDLVQAMPSAKASAKDRAATDYWGASIISTLTEAWRSKAKRDAIAQAALPDHAKKPFPVGTTESVYVGPMVTITLKVTPQADKLDVPGLLADLEKLPIPPATLQRLVKKHMRPFPGAHVFTASLTQGGKV